MRRTAANCGKGGEVRQLRQMRQVAATAAKTTTPATSREIQGKSSRESQKAAPDPTALPIFFFNLPPIFSIFFSIIPHLFLNFFPPIPSRLYFHFPGFIQWFLPGGFQYVKRLYLLWCFLGKERERGKLGGARVWGDEWGRGGETTLFSVHIVGLFLFI